MNNIEESKYEHCPICYKTCSLAEIEYHVNKCIFLNTTNTETNKHKRKRSPSPQPKLNNKKQTFFNSKETTARFSFTTPLTEQIQPKYLSDLIGQNQVLGRNTFLRLLLEENDIPNIILWGPPGCGKTSLANIIREICTKNSQQYKYIYFNYGVKEIRDVIVTAKKDLEKGQRTVVFIDEIHRFNKKEQKSFLPSVIKGDIILVGASTENPSFTLNNSLLNCCKVIVMEKLDSYHLITIIEKALQVLNIKIIDDGNTIHNMYQTNNSICIHRSAIKFLADTSDGDARIALNNLQLILQHTNDKKVLKISNIKDQIKKVHQLYDRNGEEHNNIISAMHESIKGYNDNAALYWTARMIVGGEDPLYIARRLIRTASEDTGNADPKALRLTVSTMCGCEMLEKSDAEILVAQCAIYLSRAPTNKQTISSLNLAKKVISECQGQQPAVPVHLRDIPLKLLKELDDGTNNTRKKSFMPIGLENVNFL